MRLRLLAISERGEEVHLDRSTFRFRTKEKTTTVSAHLGIASQIQTKMSPPKRRTTCCVKQTQLIS